MPVHLLQEASGPLEAQLPSHVQRSKLKDLQLGIDQTDKYFLGCVMLVYPQTKLGNGLELLKAVIEDTSEEDADCKIKTINTFFFGKIAEDCGRLIQQGVTLALCGFNLTKSPSASRDGRHHCQLEVMEENGANVYILNKSSVPQTSRVRSTAFSHKYLYTPLDKLKEGTIVNIFGVVTFFKPPYRSKGTDFCSVTTIVDQSGVKLKCLLFSGSQDILPKIYKTGDIVRFHRLKIQYFNSEIQGITSSGFSALVFDGTVGTPLLPRTASKIYTFTDEDQKTVHMLREWAANHLNFCGSRIKLSEIKPGQFFDVICQLVGKAEVDKSSFLLKVWDGTKCASPTWKVCVEHDALEGDRTLIHKLENLTIDILVYDNHVETAKLLKTGSCIVIHSVHAKLHAANQAIQAHASYLEFHLHGGTCYGRGFTVLPEDNSDVQDLKKFLDSVDLQDSQYLDDMSPLELNSLYTTLSGHTNHEQWETTPLTTVIKNKAPQKYRIRARLRKFEPSNLYQSVKLHCTKCTSLHEVPDEDDINLILEESSKDSAIPDSQESTWYQSAVWKTSNQQNRLITIHFVKKDDMHQNPEDALIMIEGGTVQEICKLSRQFNSIIPVKSCEQGLEFDLSTPFLIQGNRWHYGCRNCSSLKNLDALCSIVHETSWDASTIAKVLGIEPLSYVFVMQFTLDDGTESLNAYLWNYSEQFFQIPASEISFNSELQEKMQATMDKLCPTRKKLSDYPWLECCIRSYNSTNGENEKICYEIFDTIVAEKDI
ncbi:protection of telomeres protein 1 isoform X2 [Bombina bombina]|uniref:protection of telomeres protein 1 isoform X2 n=1 Tax=Bombina bombina TaxID=8345 RepID=UPI00235A571B|nr:protection of telomeres protein 1 isoform X2 [Bombina bombina]